MHQKEAKSFTESIAGAWDNLTDRQKQYIIASGIGTAGGAGIGALAGGTKGALWGALAGGTALPGAMMGYDALSEQVSPESPKKDSHIYANKELAQKSVDDNEASTKDRISRSLDPIYELQAEQMLRQQKEQTDLRKIYEKGAPRKGWLNAIVDNVPLHIPGTDPVYPHLSVGGLIQHYLGRGSNEATEQEKFDSLVKGLRKRDMGIMGKSSTVDGVTTPNIHNFKRLERVVQAVQKSVGSDGRLLYTDFGDALLKDGLKSPGDSIAGNTEFINDLEKKYATKKWKPFNKKEPLGGALPDYVGKTGIKSSRTNKSNIQRGSQIIGALALLGAGGYAGNKLYDKSKEDQRNKDFDEISSL